MPRDIKTHDKCREESCCCCGGYAKPGIVSEKISERVRRWAKREWDPAIFSYPTGVCTACRARLLECEKEGSSILPNRPGQKHLWDQFQLQNITVPRGQLAEACGCNICKARKLKVGQPGCSPNPATLKKRKVETKVESEESKEKVSPETRCAKCLQVTGTGVKKF